MEKFGCEWNDAPHSMGTTITAVQGDGGVILGADSHTTTCLPGMEQADNINSLIHSSTTKVTEYIAGLLDKNAFDALVVSSYVASVLREFVVTAEKTTRLYNRLQSKSPELIRVLVGAQAGLVRQLANIRPTERICLSRVGNWIHDHPEVLPLLDVEPQTLRLIVEHENKKIVSDLDEDARLRVAVKYVLKQHPEYAPLCKLPFYLKIKYALDFPHFLRYQRVASMRYMDRFEVKDQTKETYIERGFSRITHAGNLRLLAFAKRDFNSCQALYREEVRVLERWEEECRFQDISFVRRPLYHAYLTAVGSSSAPELALARTCWTMNSVLATAVDDLFDETSDLSELRLFVECIRRWDLSLVENCAESLKIIARSLVSSVDYLSKETSIVQGRDTSHFYQRIWLDLLVSMLTEAEWTASGYKPSSDEYMDTGHISFALGPIVPLSMFFLGEVIPDEHLESQEYWDVFRTISSLGRLLNDSRTYQRDAKGGHVSAVAVHMRDHPELTAEQSWTKVSDMVKESRSKALSKLLNPPYSYSPGASGWLGMVRALDMMYYKNADGFTINPAEMKEDIQRLFFQPFSDE